MLPRRAANQPANEQARKYSSVIYSIFHSLCSIYYIACSLHAHFFSFSFCLFKFNVNVVIFPFKRATERKMRQKMIALLSINFGVCAFLRKRHFFLFFLFSLSFVCQFFCMHTMLFRNYEIMSREL